MCKRFGEEPPRFHEAMVSSPCCAGHNFVLISFLSISWWNPFKKFPECHTIKHNERAALICIIPGAVVVVLLPISSDLPPQKVQLHSLGHSFTKSHAPGLSLRCCVFKPNIFGMCLDHLAPLPLLLGKHVMDAWKYYRHRTGWQWDIKAIWMYIVEVNTYIIYDWLKWVSI